MSISSDHPARHYAIVSFDRAPVKSWQKLVQIRRHNNREDDLAHVHANAPAPEYLIGSADVVGDYRRRLAAHSIDADRIRQGGVMAREVVFTSDHFFFNTDDVIADIERASEWAVRTVEFAKGHWGPERVVNATLHHDEHTLHIHMLVVPLKCAVMRRWPERGPTWRLEDRVLSGPGQWQLLQTAYAEAMKPMGLERGREGSNAKKRPYREILEELERERIQFELSAQYAREVEEDGRRALAAALTLDEQTQTKIEHAEKLKREAEEQARNAAQAELSWSSAAQPLGTVISLAVDVMEATKALPFDSLPPPLLTILAQFRELRAMIEALPTEQLSSEVAASYLGLKARGRLH
jgi:hypothetical protein